MSKPLVKPRWANVGGAVATPLSGEQDIGWLPGEKPPAQYLNWLALHNYNWTNWLDGLFPSDNLVLDTNKSVTVSGTGNLNVTGSGKVTAPDFRFTNVQTYNVAACAMQAIAAGPTFNGASWTHGTAAQLLFVPLDVRVGDTIESWLAHFVKSSTSGTLTASLVRFGMISGSPTTIGSAQTNSANNPGTIVLGQVVNHVVLADHQYYVIITPSGVTGDSTRGVQFNVLRP